MSNILAVEMARPGNRHCASCIGALSFPVIKARVVQSHTHTRLTAVCPTTQVSRYQKGKTNQCSGISWATYKSAPRSRQITTPTPHHSLAQAPSCDK